MFFSSKFAYTLHFYRFPTERIDGFQVRPIFTFLGFELEIPWKESNILTTKHNFTCTILKIFFEFKSHLCRCLLKLKPFTCVDFKEKWFFLYLHITSFGLVLKLLFETQKKFSSSFITKHSLSNRFLAFMKLGIRLKVLYKLPQISNLNDISKDFY